MRTLPPGLSRRHVLRSLVGGSLLLPAILSELLADPPAQAPTDHRDNPHPP